MKTVIKKNLSALAGTLLFLVGLIAFMGIITAEIYYPEGYSTRENEISDLGATKPPDSIITQPSASIFNTSMISAGMLALLATLFVYMKYNQIVPTLLLGFLAVGIVGVGIFPGNITPWHSIFAFIIFISGGLGAIVVSYMLVESALRHLLIILGGISLVFLFFSDVFIPFLGTGGTERWVVYPIIFWLMGLGSYLVGKNEE